MIHLYRFCSFVSFSSLLINKSINKNSLFNHYRVFVPLDMGISLDQPTNEYFLFSTIHGLLLTIFLALNDIVECYKATIKQNLDISVSVAAIKTLTMYIQSNRANTMIEFTRDLEAATKNLLAGVQNCVAVTAGCELFTRFVTRSSADANEVTEQ